MQNRMRGSRMAVLAGLLLLASGASLEAGPQERQGPAPQVRQEYRERMRALPEEFRSRLLSLKAEYRARRQALRAEFNARHGAGEQQGTPGPGPGPQTP